jgi:hypothetical protein
MLSTMYNRRTWNTSTVLLCHPWSWVLLLECDIQYHAYHNLKFFWCKFRADDYIQLSDLTRGSCENATIDPQKESSLRSIQVSNQLSYREQLWFRLIDLKACLHLEFFMRFFCCDFLLLMHVNEWMSYKCSFEVTHTRNIYYSFNRSHP